MSDGLDAGYSVALDLDELIVSRLLIQANSGGGKSWLIRKLLEEASGKVQCIVFDPEGEFGTLRERYPFMLAGRKGDFPISLPAVEKVARRILELEVSIILDLSDLDKEERPPYVARFLDAMLEAPEALWHPVLVVIDEAHDYAPQKSHKGQEENPAKSKVINLAAKGRKRGFCAVLATQRLSKLDKDAVAELNNKILGRAVYGDDREQEAEELGIRNRDEILALRKLKPGTFFAFGPALRTRGDEVDIVKVRVGPVQTTHPTAGQRKYGQVRTTPTPGELKELVGQFSDLPQEAEKERLDVDGLQLEVRRLRGELSRKAPAGPNWEEMRATRQEYFETGRSAGRAETLDRVKVLQGRVEVMRGALGDIASLATATIEASRKDMPHGITDKPQIGDVVGLRGVEHLPIPSAGRDDGDPIPTSLDEKPLKTGAVEMVRIACRFGPNPISRDQLAIWTEKAASGGTFKDYLSLILRRGYLVDRPDGYHIAEKARREFGDCAPMPTDPKELLDLWLPKFKEGGQKMLREIYRASEVGAGTTKEALGAVTGFAPGGGTFKDYLSVLRRSGLVQERDGFLYFVPNVEQKTTIFERRF